jgi:hypothetical protein
MFSWQLLGNHSPIGLYSAWTLHWRQDGLLCTHSPMDPGTSTLCDATCHLIQCCRDLLRGLSRKSLNLYSAHIMASSTVALVCIFSLLSFCVLTISVELKELIALHSSLGEYGGDLRTDTVTIIGATLDLQEKTTSQVRVFYLSIIRLNHPRKL